MPGSDQSRTVRRRWRVTFIGAQLLTVPYGNLPSDRWPFEVYSKQPPAQPSGSGVALTTSQEVPNNNGGSPSRIRMNTNRSPTVGNRNSLSPGPRSAKATRASVARAEPSTDTASLGIGACVGWPCSMHAESTRARLRNNKPKRGNGDLLTDRRLRSLRMAANGRSLSSQNPRI